MGKLQRNINDLDTWSRENGEYGEQVRVEFSGKDEYGDIYPIDGVAYGSKKRMFWTCSTCGEGWYARVVDRTRGRKCPYCNRGGRKKQ